MTYNWFVILLNTTILSGLTYILLYSCSISYLDPLYILYDGLPNNWTKILVIFCRNLVTKWRKLLLNDKILEKI